MNKSKFHLLIIIVLLIGNVVLLFLLFNPLNKQGEGPKYYIINALKFDEIQSLKYEKEIGIHRELTNLNEEKMNELRNSLYQQLMYSQNKRVTDSLISLIGEQQMLAEQINYNHFLKIKDFCKPHQIRDFQSLTKEIAQLFATKHRKKL
jgi:hypothetical protein